MYTMLSWALRGLARCTGTPANAFILYTSILHLFWAIAVLADPMTIHITTIAGLSALSPLVIAALFLGVAVTSIYAVTTSRLSAFARLLLMLPQQGLMILSAVVILLCIVHGRYGDTAVYPRWFIAADQAHWLLTTLFHTYAVWETGHITWLFRRPASRA